MTTTSEQRPGYRPFYRPMTARDTAEEHRAATPLELFFDLCFVVAVAQAAVLLEHDVAEDHIGHGLTFYAMVFFAIWWAWMNFTWFASAYDTDDDVYRLAVLVAIAGALVIAAGIPTAFESADLLLVTVGYTMMRFAGVAQWLRAARSDPAHRQTALRFATGVALVQVGWLLRLLVPAGPWGYVTFLTLVVLELSVPIWGERSGSTPWHPGHIAERYGLFTLIVLGEAVLAASLAIEGGLGEHADAGLLVLAGSSIVIVFAMWWQYFDRVVEPSHRPLATFAWGYSHYLIFAAAAAVGAGIAVDVEHHLGRSHISDLVAGYGLAVPISVYVLFVWALHVGRRQPIAMTYGPPVAAVLICLTPLLPFIAQAPVMAAVIAVMVAAKVVAARRAALVEAAPEAVM